MHPQFPLIASALKAELESQGFLINANPDSNEIVCTDVVGNNIGGLPTAEPTFVVRVENA